MPVKPILARTRAAYQETEETEVPTGTHLIQSPRAGRCMVATGTRFKPETKNLATLSRETSPKCLEILYQPQN